MCEDNESRFHLFMGAYLRADYRNSVFSLYAFDSFDALEGKGNTREILLDGKGHWWNY
jgi:hypothetical protein